MRKSYTVIAFLLLFGIVSTAVMVALLPDTVPTHYNAGGQVDAYGSKYTYFVFPALAAVAAASMLLLHWYQRKKQAPPEEQRVILWLAALMVALFDGLGLFFTVAAKNAGPGTSLPPEAPADLVFIATGVLLVVLGNLMPKIRRNSLFGLRTRWSMSSDEAWRRSQRFAGFSAVLCGVALVVLAAVLPMFWSAVICTALVILWLVVCVAASWRFGRKTA